MDAVGRGKIVFSISERTGNIWMAECGGVAEYVATQGDQDRGSFPNQEAAMKLLYLALEHIAKKWTMPVQNWKAALQRFAILLGDRVPKAELA